MFDVVVVGAGVVGLAVARRFAASGRSVLVLEQHGLPGQETSSRNSEVIHAGLYYRPGSLKARLCVAGYRQLLDYCQRRRVPYDILGKLILASDEAGERKLLAIGANARANGVELGDLLPQRRVRDMEPAVECRSALYSPLTGIIDSHALMMSYQADIEAEGGQLVCHHRVVGAERSGNHWLLQVRDSDGVRSEVGTSLLVNAAGLGAIDLARRLQPGEASWLPQPAFAKGSYFTYSGRLPVRHLLYPTPEDGGLGVHLTLDFQGRLRFGPDVEYLCSESLDYRVHEDRRSAFAKAVQTYLPNIDPDKLSPAYAGIRPRVRVDGKVSDDFIIQRGEPAGVVHLFGIESPGLTASLAIADAVFEAF